MQTLTSISKLLVAAFFLSFVVLFWKYSTGPGFFSGAATKIEESDINENSSITALHTKNLIENDTSNLNLIKQKINTQLFSSHAALNKIAAPSTTIQKTTVQTTTTQTTVLPNSPSLWSELREQFKLDLKSDSPRVKKEISKILQDRKKLNKILTSAVPYLYYIHTQTQARKLPAELALIPVIESEFNPNDRSHKGATGLWQIMPQTGRELGIKIHQGYDGRRNVTASTKAALAYFNDLGKLFKGNWYLAIAAYNCGQVKVKSIMRKTNLNDYWSLPLPLETKLYVPKLLAVAEIIKNPKKYGVTLPTIHHQPFFKEIEIKKSVNLTQYAKNAGIDLQTLKVLNPDYKLDSTLNEIKQKLLIPV